MKYIFTPFLVLIFNLNLFAQSKDFPELVELEKDNKVRFYLNGVFKIAYESCADYYMITDFEDSLFQFKDTVRIFYKSGTKHQICAYKNGMRDGLFKSYHENGLVSIIGKYTNNMRTGLWQYFYNNGNKYKTIYFHEGVEYLYDFYKKDGTQLVSEGNGEFHDKVFSSLANTSYAEWNGMVIKGLPDDKWTMLINGEKVATEFFENGTFVKGISYSKLNGKQEYHDRINSTYSGIYFIEHLGIIAPPICGDRWTLALGEEYFNKIKARYNNSKELKTLKNGWFLVEIHSNRNQEIVEINLISNAEQSKQDALYQLISDLKTVPKNQHHSARYGYFPLVIKDYKIHFRHDEEIELLKFRY